MILYMWMFQKIDNRSKYLFIKITLISLIEPILKSIDSDNFCIITNNIVWNYF